MGHGIFCRWCSCFLRTKYILSLEMKWTGLPIFERTFFAHSFYCFDADRDAHVLLKLS